MVTLWPGNGIAMAYVCKKGWGGVEGHNTLSRSEMTEEVRKHERYGRARSRGKTQRNVGIAISHVAPGHSLQPVGRVSM